MVTSEQLLLSFHEYIKMYHFQLQSEVKKQHNWYLLQVGILSLHGKVSGVKDQWSPGLVLITHIWIEGNIWINLNHSSP